MISLSFNGMTVSDCLSVIMVPEIAVNEPGNIKTLTSSAQANAKHEFHALAQMAYYQYQDEELEITIMPGMCRVNWHQDVDELSSGLVIYRNSTGQFKVAVHEGLNVKRLLEAANRFCTRWVRLDI